MLSGHVVFVKCSCPILVQLQWADVVLDLNCWMSSFFSDGCQWLLLMLLATTSKTFSSNSLLSDVLASPMTRGPAEHVLDVGDSVLD